MILVIVGAVHADTITLRGRGGAVLRQVTVDRIVDGQVIYRDQRGRMHDRPVGEVATISFDALPGLDAAERELDSDRQRGIDRLLQAALTAEGSAQKRWTRARLARAHAATGEFVEAASHAAWVFAMDDDGAWADLAPVGRVNDKATGAAVMEAMTNIKLAQRRVKDGDLVIALDRLARALGPTYRSWLQRGVTDDDGAETLSGRDRATILRGSTGATTATLPSWDPEPVPGVVGDRAERSDAGETAMIVEQLLRQEEVAQAVAMYEQMSADAQRGARVWYLGGQVYAAAERVDDALVAYTRCAILHEQSEYATQALIEAALLYREYKVDEVTAARLLKLAAARAEENRHAAAGQRVREVAGVVDRD